MRQMRGDALLYYAFRECRKSNLSDVSIRLNSSQPMKSGLDWRGGEEGAVCSEASLALVLSDSNEISLA